MYEKAIYDDKLYPCQLCGLVNVQKRRDSPYTPKYCKPCAAKLRAQTLRQHNMAKKRALIDEGLVAIAPDGYEIRLKNEDEKKFFDERLASYKKDFEFVGSADLGLLTRLLTLEIQIHRETKDSYVKQSVRQTTNITKMMEEYRRCQQDLGVVRAKRIEDKKEDNAAVVVQDILERYRKLKKEHPEKFKWKCKHCGQLNELYIKNDTEIPDSNKTGNGDSGGDKQPDSVL